VRAQRLLASALGVVALVIHVTSVTMSLDLGSTFWTQAIPNTMGLAVGLAAVLRSRSTGFAWLVLLAFFGISTSELLIVSEWLVANGSESAAAWWVVTFGTTADGFGALIFLLLAPVMALAVLYPTGTLPGRGWRWFPPVLFIVLAVGSVAAFLTEPVVREQVLVHPMLGDSASRSMLDVQFGVFFVASMLFVVSVGSLIGRFRRAEAVVRQQIKWFAFGVAVYALFNLAMFFATETHLPGSGEAAPLVSEQASIVLDSIVFSLIPIAIGFAMFRYRLFEVDRFISRTVTYALVLVAVAGLFVLVVSIPSVVLASEDIASWQIAVATLAAAAVFNPLRQRMQGLVDRRFDRARFDAQSVLEGFADGVRDETDLETVAAGLGRAAAEVFRPESLGIWLRRESKPTGSAS
jgi:hypothetical protein